MLLVSYTVISILHSRTYIAVLSGIDDEQLVLTFDSDMCWVSGSDEEDMDANMQQPGHF